MTHQIRLSDEEFDEFDLILRQELRSTKTELRRTRNPDYRVEVRRRMELIEQILDVFDRAKPVHDISMRKTPWR